MRRRPSRGAVADSYTSYVEVLGLAVSDAELSALAAETAAELGVAGAQVSVLHGGRISEGFAGVANAETAVPVTPDTLFQIGSTTKVLTAALVMGLVEEGRIGLDVPVVEQLPGFRLSDPQALARVTPRHLMSMSSGIENGPYTDYGRGDDALTRYVASLADLRQVFPPGEGFGYSNASTCVSGRLVEHVTGHVWEEALRTRLLEPAQLVDTAAFPEEIIVRRFARGHTSDDHGRPMLHSRWSGPRSKGPSAGSVCSTATDLVRLAHVFLHRGRSLEGTQVLSPAVVEAMQRREVAVPTPLPADWWGLGPYGKEWDGVEVIGHSGTNLSGSSYLLWAVECDVAIATTVNSPDLGYSFAARIFRELFHAIAAINVPSDPEPCEDVQVDASRLVGTYAMSCLSLTIGMANGGLAISGSSSIPGMEGEIPLSPLVPLSPTAFLPTNPAVDGGRGWALAFIGVEDGRATHLFNGFWALRRNDA